MSLPNVSYTPCQCCCVEQPLGGETVWFVVPIGIRFDGFVLFQKIYCYPEILRLLRSIFDKHLDCRSISRCFRGEVFFYHKSPQSFDQNFFPIHVYSSLLCFNVRYFELYGKVIVSEKEINRILWKILIVPDFARNHSRPFWSYSIS